MTSTTFSLAQVGYFGLSVPAVVRKYHEAFLTGLRETIMSTSLPPPHHEIVPFEFIGFENAAALAGLVRDQSRSIYQMADLIHRASAQSYFLRRKGTSGKICFNEPRDLFRLFQIEAITHDLIHYMDQLPFRPWERRVLYFLIQTLIASKEKVLGLQYPCRHRAGINLWLKTRTMENYLEDIIHDLMDFYAKNLLDALIRTANFFYPQDAQRVYAGRDDE